MYQYLNLTNGTHREAYWEEITPLRGESSMLNTGELPNAAVESSLSATLMIRVHPRFYLSQTACQGILRRASDRSKRLPEPLKTALIRQSKWGWGGGQYYDSHPSDSRVTGPETVASTVCSKYGTGGGNTPLVQEPKVFGFSPKSSNAMKSSNPDSGCYQADSVRTLDHRGGDPNCDQGGMAIVETVDVRLSSDGTINRRSHIYETARVRCLDTGGQNPDSNHGGVAIVHAVDMGGGKSVVDVLEEKSPTLSTTHYGAPAVNVKQVMASQQGECPISEKVCPTITAKSGTGGNNQPIACIKEDQ